MLYPLIQGSGYVRGRRAEKEWLHFCITGDEVEVLANFSLMNNVARVALILRTADQWDGDVEIVSDDVVRLERGTMNFTFGQSSLRFDEDGFHLSIALTDRPLTAELHLVPETMPLLRPNTPLERDNAIHWLVVPRLRASGRVISGARTFAIDRAPAYHDHNWGKFSWGDDFAWQWGFGLPPGLALAFVRLVDRARTCDIGHGLFFWKGEAQHRIFREGELSVRPSGWLRKERVTKLPRAMALVAPELATDVPAKIEISARGRGDAIEVAFEAEDMVQLLVPNDRDLGVTAINEITGFYSIEGSLAGEHLAIKGRGFFEVLSVSRGAAVAVTRARSEDRVGQTRLTAEQVRLPRRAGTRARPGISGFRAFLCASLDMLRAEVPAAYAQMCEALEGRVVRIDAGGETVMLGFSKTAAIECSSQSAEVRLSTDKETILALAGAELTLARAVLEDKVLLAGRSRDLIHFDLGLMSYLGGAMRAPSFPALLEDYRRNQG